MSFGLNLDTPRANLDLVGIGRQEKFRAKSSGGHFTIEPWHTLVGTFSKRAHVLLQRDGVQQRVRGEQVLPATAFLGNWLVVSIKEDE